MKNRISAGAIKYTILFLSILFLQACGQTKEDKQKYVNGYIEIIKELRNKNDLMKKGHEAIIAYRKSEFNDLVSAEKAKDAILEKIMQDSLTLSRLMNLDAPDDKCKEISMDLKRGIDSETEGNRLFAENYSQAKSQTLDERKATILNVKPGLTKMAEGLNAVVVSLIKMDEYIMQNELEGKKEVGYWFEMFKKERDSLKNLLRM